MNDFKFKITAYADGRLYESPIFYAHDMFRQLGHGIGYSSRNMRYASAMNASLSALRQICYCVRSCNRDFDASFCRINDTCTLTCFGFNILGLQEFYRELTNIVIHTDNANAFSVYLDYKRFAISEDL